MYSLVSLSIFCIEPHNPRYYHLKFDIYQFAEGSFKGTTILSADREGFPIERDKRTQLSIIKEEDKISEFEYGTWIHWEKGYEALIASMRNQKDFPNGELRLFNEEGLVD